MDEYLVNLISQVEYEAQTPQEAADELVRLMAEEIERNR